MRGGRATFLLFWWGQIWGQLLDRVLSSLILLGCGAISTSIPVSRSQRKRDIRKDVSFSLRAQRRQSFSRGTCENDPPPDVSETFTSANVKQNFTSLGNHFFTLYGNQIFTLHGKEFFALFGKENFTLCGKQFFTSPYSLLCQVKYLVNWIDQDA